MAGSCIRGPIGYGSVPNIQDGTLILWPSSLPGSNCSSLSITAILDSLTAQTRTALNDLLKKTDQLDTLFHDLLKASQGGAPLALLDDLIKATDINALKETIQLLLGPHCFSMGIIAGFTSEVITTIVDLLNLVKTFVLADLYDLYIGLGKGQLVVGDFLFLPIPLSPIGSRVQRELVAKLAGTFFKERLSKAAEERDALILEVTKILEDPKLFFELFLENLWAKYERDWQEYMFHKSTGTLEGQFRAGMIVGQLLFDIVNLILTVVPIAQGVGVAITAASTAARQAGIAAKMPRLLRLAQSLKGMLSRPAGVPRGVRAVEGGGGAPSASPSIPDPRPAAPRPGPRSAAPPPEPLPPPGKPRMSPYGDLTAEELAKLQRVAAEIGEPVDVVGSTAKGTRRGVGTDSPLGKGPGKKSDLDIRLDSEADIRGRGKASEAVYKEFPKGKDVDSILTSDPHPGEPRITINPDGSVVTHNNVPLRGN